MQLAEGGNYSDREESIGYYKRILEFDIAPERRGLILNRIGFFNWQLGNYEEALMSYQQALPLFEELRDSMFLGRIYNNMAVAYWGLGDNIEALKRYHLSLEIRKDIKDQLGITRVLNNIGKIYQELGLYEEALKMHEEALAIASELNDSGTMAYSYSNLGDCYEHYKQLEKALATFQRGFEILKNYDSESRSNSFFSSSIGSIYTKMNQLDSALFYNKRAVDYAYRINNRNRIAVAQLKLGRTYLSVHQADSARKYISLSYQTSIEKGYSVLRKDNLFALAELEEYQGNTKKAFQHYKQASVLNDSIYNEDVVAKVAEVQVKYVTEQQHKENLLLRKNNEIQEVIIRQQRRFTWILVVASAIILVILFFMTKSRASIKRLNQQLEKSEQNLKRANSDKDRFFTIIAHDLKSPFNGLMGITELLDSDYDNLSQNNIRELIGLLRKSSVNVVSLLEGLLQWAKTQLKNTHYDFDYFNIYPNSLRITESFAMSAEAKNIKIENTIPADISIYADAESFSTVLRNLISNAIKFTSENGLILVSAAKKGSEIIISVQDSGKGMSEEKISTLFSISEKVSEPGTNGEPGTGLGLIICKELVEKHQGKIWVESKPDVGSTFSFTMPSNK